MASTDGGTVFFKSCLRCSGDRALENDSDGWYVLCLHCDHVAYPDIPDAKAERRAERLAQQAASQAAAVPSAAFPRDGEDWRVLLGRTG